MFVEFSPLNRESKNTSMFKCLNSMDLLFFHCPLQRRFWFSLNPYIVLLQLLTWLHVLDYHNFWNIKKMVVWKLIVCHQIIVSGAETSYKMASKLCQKWF